MESFFQTVFIDFFIFFLILKITFIKLSYRAPYNKKAKKGGIKGRTIVFACKKFSCFLVQHNFQIVQCEKVIKHEKKCQFVFPVFWYMDMQKAKEQYFVPF